MENGGYIFPMFDSFNEEFKYQINKLSRFTNHGSSLGRFVEVLLIDLLKKYMPNKYTFSSGFYYSQNPICNQMVSMQMDIICYDRQNFAMLFDSNDTVVVTPAAVKSLIEVKSTLTRSLLDQLLKQSNSEISKQLPLTTKFNLISVKSSISSNTVCKQLEKYYSENDSIIRALGAIYSLDWNDIIMFDTRNEEYMMYQLQNFNYGISSFINQLIIEIYGTDSYLATTNSIGPSIFIPRKTVKLR